MLLKKMFKLCEKKKTVVIKKYKGYKYLSCGAVTAYIHEEAPDWDANDCLIAMNVDSDDREKYTIEETENVTMPESRNLKQLSRGAYSLNVYGDTLQPFELKDGRVMFIKMEHLVVFRDEGIKSYAYDDSSPYELYVMIDGFVHGIIEPVTVNLNAMVNFLTGITESARRSAKMGYLDAGGQMEFHGI